MAEHVSSTDKQSAPHSESGVITCPAELTYGRLVDAIEAAGWSSDGFHPEPESATIGALLQRRQPRPHHWGCGLLASRCLGIEAQRPNGETYRAVGAPRKSAGPDLSFLFIGGEGRYGTIVQARFSLVKPAPRYLCVASRFEEPKPLFEAARVVAMLDPLSTRHLNPVDMSFKGYVPCRQKDDRELRGRLDGLGLQIEESETIPRTARFSDSGPSGGAEAGPTCQLQVSAPYRTVEKLLSEAQSELRDTDGKTWLGYPDMHGLSAVFRAPAKSFSLLERLYEQIIEGGDFDDVTLHDKSGELRTPTMCLEDVGVAE